MTTSAIGATPAVTTTQKPQEALKTSKLGSLVNKVHTFTKAAFTSIGSVFTRKDHFEKHLKNANEAAIFTASKIVADRFSLANHAQAKKSPADIRFDFVKNSSYNVFTETVEKYVPIARDGKIDPTKAILVCNTNGPVSSIHTL